MTQRIFLGSEIQQPAPGGARFHIIPVPYEKTVSYGGGTVEGPAAIIEASDQLETYDQLGGEPCRAGIYTHAAIDCRGEAGDVSVYAKLPHKAICRLSSVANTPSAMAR